MCSDEIFVYKSIKEFIDLALVSAQTLQKYL